MGYLRCMLWLFGILRASELERTVFQEGDILKALEMTPTVPSDYAIRYFLLKYFTEKHEDAFVSLLLGDKEDPVLKLLVVRRFGSEESEVEVPLAKKANFQIEASKDVVDSYFSNPYNFREYELLDNSSYNSGQVNDTLVNIWTKDRNVIKKFLYFIEQRIIKVQDVLPILKHLCDQNVPRAFGILGDAYFYGLGVERDLGTALEYYWAGRDMGDVKCYVGIGKVLMDEQFGDYAGAEVAFDAARGIELDPEAFFYKYLLLKRNPNKKINPSSTLYSSVARGFIPAVFYNTVEQLKNPTKYTLTSSLYSLGSIVRYSPYLLDLDERARTAYSQKKYKEAALLYLYLSMFKIDNPLKNAAFILQNHVILPELDTNGICISQEKLLFNLYTELAKKNQWYYLKLGDCYFYGKGVPVSKEKAFTYYLCASEHSGEASYNLAYMYETGQGVAQNLSLAYKYADSNIWRKKYYLLRVYTKARILSKMLFKYYSHWAIAVLVGMIGCIFIVARK